MDKLNMNIKFFQETIKVYSIYMLFPLFMLFSVRSTEFIFLIDSELELSKGVFQSLTWAVEFDLIFYSLFYLILLPIFYLLFYLSRKWAKITLVSIIVLFALILLSLTHFFHVNHVLLDDTIFYFSFNEISHIVFSEIDNMYSKFLWLYGFLIISVLVTLVFNKYLRKIAFLFSIICFILGLVFLLVRSGDLLPTNTSYKNKFEYNLYASKPLFFSKSVLESSFLERGEEIDSEEYFRQVSYFREFMGWEKSIDQNYFPLIHPRQGNSINWNDVFPVNDSLNIVLVFSESLSSSFLGENERFGNLMPFLDSLSKKAIFFPNTLSSFDRTFGVFSSALAGLPHGFERGILNYGKMKELNYESIPLLLSKNYSKSFYYGGWSHFDNYKPFLKMNDFQNFIDEKYIKESLKIYNNKILKDNNWGFHDQTMVDIYFNTIDSVSQNKPYFNIFLTLSLHSPFIVPNQDYYIGKVNEMENEKIRNLKENKIKELSTILYTDDFYKMFFESYKKRPEYDNTLFVIVGDHDIHSFGSRNKLDKHRVPLILFHPKLKESIQYENIISHLDICDFLFDILDQSKVINSVQNDTHWLGDGRISVNRFGSDKPIFIGSYTSDIHSVIYKNILYSKGELFDINHDFSITGNDSKNLKDSLSELLKAYKSINKATVENNTIKKL